MTVRGEPSSGVRQHIGRGLLLCLTFPLSPLPSLHHPDCVGVVEAVGIEPTSEGQSPRAATSVACVLASPSERPQAG